MQPELKWVFRLPRVKSINVSGHKFGLAPLGCGWIVSRESTDLPGDLIFDVNYLGGHLPTFALNFSRPGGQVICHIFNFLRLGREGYRKVQEACYETSAWMADEIGKLGPFDLLYNGRGGIPGVTWALKPDANFWHVVRPGRSIADPRLAGAGLFDAGQLPGISSCNEFSSATVSAATWRACCLTISSERSTASSPIPSRAP